MSKVSENPPKKSSDEKKPLHEKTRAVFQNAITAISSIKNKKAEAYCEEISEKFYKRTKLTDWFYRTELKTTRPDFEDFKKIALYIAKERAQWGREQQWDENWGIIGTAEWVHTFLENELTEPEITEILAYIGGEIARGDWTGVRLPLETRIDITNELDELFLILNRAKKPRLIALTGTSGMGKTTLAKQACCDPRMWPHFADGVIWVDCSEINDRNSTSENKHKLSEVLNHLGVPTEPLDKVDVGTYTKALAKAISTRRMLIVLDNVHTPSVVDAFDVSKTDHCVLLVTTQRDEVGRKAGGSSVILKKKDEDVINYLRDLPGGDDPGAAAALESLVERLDGWPLVINLAHAYLYAQVRKAIEDNTGQSLATLIGIFLRKPAKSRCIEQDAPIGYKAFTAFIGPSIKSLEKKAAELYRALVVFAAGAAMPIDLICAFARLLPNSAASNQDVKVWLGQMANLKLLEHNPKNPNFYRFHDFIYEYLAQQPTEAQRRGWHSTCVRAMRAVSKAKTWATVPEKHTYIWNYLITHLLGAGDFEQASAVLLNYDYMTEAFVRQGVGIYTENAQRAALAFAGVAADALLPKWAAWLELHTDLLTRCQTAQEQIDTVWVRTQHEPDLQDIHAMFAAKRSAYALATLQKLDDIGALPTLKQTLPHPTTSSVIAITESVGRWYAATSKDVSNHKPEKEDEQPKPRIHAVYVWHSKTGKQRAILRIDGMGTVEKLVAYPDGIRLATIGRDNKIRLWDVDSGQQRLERSVTPASSALGFSEAHEELIIGQGAGSLLICDANELHVKGKIDLPICRPVLSLAVSPNGQYVAAANGSDVVLVRLSTREILKTITYDSLVLRVAFSPDGSSLAAATLAGTVVVYDLRTSDREIIKVSDSYLFALAFSQDGKQMAVAGWDTRVYVIARDAIQTKIYPVGKHTNLVLDVAFTTEENNIISASGDGSVHIWKNESCKAALPPPTRHQAWVRSASFNGAGTRVVSVDTGGYAIVWDVQTRQPLHKTFKHEKELSFARFIADDSAYVACSQAGELNLFDANTSAIIRAFKIRIPATRKSRIRDMVVGHTHPWLICGDSQGRVLVFDHNSEDRLQTLYGHTRYITSLALSADDTVLVTCARDGQILVWDTATWQQSSWLSIEPPNNPDVEIEIFYTLAFSPDNTFLASGNLNGWVYIWQLTEGGNHFKLLHSIKASPISKGAILGLAFHPSGQTLLTSSIDEKVRCFDVRSGELLTRFYSDSMVFDCEFHPHQPDLIAIATEHEVAWLSNQAHP
jgi:WD40 repeat protein